MLRQFMFVFLFAGNSVSASVVDSNIFRVGARWTWSYSEELPVGWSSPYLYETYLVEERMGNLVKISMSSTSNTHDIFEPHHYFIADLTDCLEVGNSVGRLNRFNIDFYTRSFSGKWERVSKKHKGLAFTEKFNCLGNWIQKKTSKQTTLFGQDTELFQLVGTTIRSWYLASGKETGVAVLRYTKNYKMELVESSQ